MKKLLFMLITSSLIVACSKHEVKSQEYYYTHLDEAQKTAEFCKTADRSDQNINQDCLNAAGAISQKIIDNGIKKAPAYGTYKINTQF